MVGRHARVPRTGMPFAKGHGSENDFVLLPDPDGRLDLGPDLVRALCDRRGGIGADGVLRVVRSAVAVEASTAGAEWFMDYRNADGSVAEMCGNGIRVFARYLVATGLAAPGRLPIATRGGVRAVDVPAAGDVTVDMGSAALLAPDAVAVAVGGRRWPATGVSIGNPHAVVFVDDLADAGDLREPPLVDDPHGAFPTGVNVEFVVLLEPGHLRVRVHERGVGETRSCGTGACAAAIAAARCGGGSPAGGWTVDLPGGRLRVVPRVDGRVELSGPAVLVAVGELDPEWVKGASR